MNNNSIEFIQRELCSTPYEITVESTVTSTNTIMKESARNGAAEFSVLIASHQSSGRGRLGKTFHSPDNTGLYMSILLRPGENSNPLFITTDAAVCCARVFERMSGKNAYIKWVNDIYIDNKKVCGILTEGASGKNGYAVLGIGANIIPPSDGFPQDIRERAGCIFSQNSPFIREKVAIEILKEFLGIYTGKDSADDILHEYRQRSMVIGKEIEIIRDNKTENAVALSVEDDYSLLVKTQSGKIQALSSGDISIKI